MKTDLGRKANLALTVFDLIFRTIELETSENEKDKSILSLGVNGIPPIKHRETGLLCDVVVVFELSTSK